MTHPRVGIIVGRNVFRGIRLGSRTRRERIDFYVEACREYELTPCFFRIQDVNLSNRTVRALVPDEHGRYRLRRIPLPRVIHNRTLAFTAAAKAKLRRLNRVRTVFNGGNRYGKLKIHELLMEDEALRPHLPGSLPANAETVRQWMERYDELILKPDSSSIGRGVMKLERIGDVWEWRYPVNRRGSKVASARIRSRLPASMLRLFRRKRYVVQQRLPLACYQGRPFDLRVSVQRDDSGAWQVTGMAAKVAAPHKFVTNVAQGGTVYKLEEILTAYPHLDPVLVRGQLHEFALRVAEHLGERLPNLADVGLDVGITEQGVPVFIECNGRDLRYSFAEAGLQEEWKATYRNPMGYARYLHNRLEEDARLSARMTQ